MSKVGLLVALLAACGGAPPPPPAAPPAPVAPAASKTLVNVDPEGVGLGGFDPVSYRRGAPAEGQPTLVLAHGGATYRFETEPSRAAFRAAPADHAPAFGGYCAYAAAEGRLSPADPTAWLLHDGRVLVFTNADFRERFAQDPTANLARADANWPTLVEKYGK